MFGNREGKVRESARVPPGQGAAFRAMFEEQDKRAQSEMISMRKGSRPVVPSKRAGAANVPVGDATRPSASLSVSGQSERSVSRRRRSRSRSAAAQSVAAASHTAAAPSAPPAKTASGKSSLGKAASRKRSAGKASTRKGKKKNHRHHSKYKEYKNKWRSDRVRSMANRTHLDNVEISQLVGAWEEHAVNGSMDKYAFRETFGLGGKVSTVICDFVFRFFDVSDNGLLSAEEFLLGMSVLTSGTFQDKLKLAFTTYDIDNDGAITRDELRKMLRYQMVAGARLIQTMLQLDDVLQGEERELSKEELKRVNVVHDEDVPIVANDIPEMVHDAFRKYDTNKDARITFDEFLIWANKSPSIAEVTLSINGWAPGTWGLGKPSPKDSVSGDGADDVDFFSDEDDE